MNKLLIILLAVCLVSVHAFVKRDTAAQPSADVIEKLKQDFLAVSQDFGKQVQEAMDPEKLKTQFSTFVDTVNKAVNDLKASTQKQ